MYQQQEYSRLPQRVNLERSDYINNFRSIICPQECDIDRKFSPFSSSYEWARFGPIGVLRYNGYGLKAGRRNYRHIEADGIDDFLVSFPLTAPIAVSQLSRSQIVEPGACVLVATTRPFVCELVGSSYAFSQFLVRIPGSLLRQHVPSIEESCAKLISVRHGAAKILWSLTEMLFQDRGHYSESQANRFGPILLSTFTNVISMEAPESESCEHSRRRVAYSRVFERAKQFIESNVSNPKLDASMIADDCQISVSYLHASFAAFSETVGAVIREIRLQRCREALKNPHLKDRLIIEIAMRWGYESPSGFNRAYRARFGISPSEDRVTTNPM